MQRASAKDKNAALDRFLSETGSADVHPAGLRFREFANSDIVAETKSKRFS
jgi:hypothetical protein